MTKASKNTATAPLTARMQAAINEAAGRRHHHISNLTDRRVREALRDRGMIDQFDRLTAAGMEASNATDDSHYDALATASRESTCCP